MNAVLTNAGAYQLVKVALSLLPNDLAGLINYVNTFKEENPGIPVTISNEGLNVTLQVGGVRAMLTLEASQASYAVSYQQESGST